MLRGGACLGTSDFVASQQIGFVASQQIGFVASQQIGGKRRSGPRSPVTRDTTGSDMRSPNQVITHAARAAATQLRVAGAFSGTSGGRARRALVKVKHAKRPMWPSSTFDMPRRACIHLTRCLRTLHAWLQSSLIVLAALPGYLRLCCRSEGNVDRGRAAR